MTLTEADYDAAVAKAYETAAKRTQAALDTMLAEARTARAAYDAAVAKAYAALAHAHKEPRK